MAALQTFSNNITSTTIQENFTRLFILENSSLSLFSDEDFYGNLTDNITGVLLLANTTESPLEDEESWSYCSEWTSAQKNLYQTANLMTGAAFLIPATFKQSVLLVRLLLCIGYILLSFWTSAELCAPDILIWNIFLSLINIGHTGNLIYRFLPPTLSVELTELYIKVFQPLRVSKKHFKELVKEAHMATLDKGDIYAVEDASPADERLSILISGKLRVTCDDTHLHFISMHQFIDSPEWEANHEQSDDLFQVTITAEEDTSYLCWPRMRLERVLRHRPMLKVVLDSIIGKDITHKLYSLNDHLCGVEKERDRIKKKEIYSKATRSMSVDAVHTGPTGLVRSTYYQQSRNKKNPLNFSVTDLQHDRLHVQCWIPIVAKQFPAEYPFAGMQTMQQMLHQQQQLLLVPEPDAVLQPPVTLQVPETPHTPLRTRSFKRTREVKFEDKVVVA